MKTYKDLDKSIVMNAPEGAMWWNTNNNMYYKYYKKAFCFFCAGNWEVSGFEHLVEMQDDLKRIPLPNIDIPWEATEDGVCPVAHGCKIIYYTKEYPDGIYHHCPTDLYWNTVSAITSYKIIDEEYLPREDELLRKEDEAPKEHTITAKADVTITLPDNPNLELIKHLEFLQILASKFPEIKDKVIELMEVELDAWWHSTFEENNDD